MSQYPYGYPFSGQPPQQQHPPSYQPYGAYPPANSYGAPPAQQAQPPQPYVPPAAHFYAASHSAFDLNASSIPGLGAPSVGPSFPVPYNGSWDQAGYATSAPPPQHSVYNQSTPSAAAPSPYSNFPGRAPVPQNPQPAEPITVGQRGGQKQPELGSLSTEQPKEQPKAPLAEPESQDEGEISDGYFDDLYDDVPNQSSSDHGPINTSTNVVEDVAAEASDQEPNFYDTDMEEATGSGDPVGGATEHKPQEGAKTVEQTSRNRSKSYSPYLSPTEAQKGNLSSNGTGSHPQLSVETKAQNEIAHQAVQPNPSLATLNKIADRTELPAKGKQPAVAGQDPKVADVPLGSFASVSEAHNEAKKAILRLLPHGVKYQTYIEEGFDGKIIKALFTQLNLPSEPATTSSSEKPAIAQEKENQEPQKQSTGSTQADNMAKKQEERKDKIARLLAEKKAKAAVASSKTEAATEPKNVPAPTNAATTPTTKPPITRAEKDLLLQQKIEALHKAREAKKLSTSVSTQVPNPNIQKPTLALGALPAVQSTAKPPSTAGTPVPTTAGPVPQQNSSSKSATPQSPFSATHSPGVSTLLSAPRAPQQVNQRKRPVAADFMDYPPASVKRPSLANRHDSSLVISISDDEDDEDDEDDDDVEMEVDSATEDSPAPSQIMTLPRRGPSIRDYPPLTNMTAARQVSSPLNGTSTSGGKIANVDLKVREKEIAELRRKIQEAEARAKAKPKKGSSTPQTPNNGEESSMEQTAKPLTSSTGSNIGMNHKDVAPAESFDTLEVATTPKSSSGIAVVERQPALERQMRIPSVRTPDKSAKMAEKAERLRRMQEEMLRLQTEIDEDMAEEQTPGEDAEAAVESLSEIPQNGRRPNEDTLAHDSQPFTPRQEPPSDFATMRTEFDQQAQPIETVTAALSQDKSETRVVIPDPSADASTASYVSTATDTQSLPQPPLDDNIDGPLHEKRLDTVSNALEPQDGTMGGDPVASDDYEPPEPSTDGHPSADSVPDDYSPVEFTDDSEAHAVLDAQNDGEPIPGISSGSISNHGHPADEQRTETVETGRQAVDSSVPTPPTSLAPYESPLRYFHAFRFHPKYSDGVSGGLKSLTYSNRIDPHKEMCPDEWDGNDCPRGEACQFQHFQNIVPPVGPAPQKLTETPPLPDNEIILELGSSDEFTGEQKKIFNNGLREMVSSFQKSKVRDFRTIAQAIVEFRRNFLGDSSKILHLEGVSI